MSDFEEEETDSAMTPEDETDTASATRYRYYENDPDEYDTLSSDRSHRRRHRSSEHTKYRRRSPSIESLSTIPTSNENRWSSHEMKNVYRELQEISDKLQTENRILHDKEKVFKEKQRFFVKEKENYDQTVQNEIDTRWRDLQQRHKEDFEKNENLIKEKAKENKRLKENFETLKSANDILKKQLEELQKEHEKLEKQSVNLQARLTNLQRKQEHADRQKETEQLLHEALHIKQPVRDKPETKPASTALSAVKATKIDVLSILLEWVSEISLRQSPPGGSISNNIVHHDIASIQDRCFKIIPSLVDLLRDIPSRNPKALLPCLQFLYWALLHIDNAHGQQKANLSSTLRRVGEELYKGRTPRVGFEEEDYSVSSAPAKPDKTRDSLFRNPNMHIRFLSALLILKTVNQVDHLANVLEVLRNDLKTDAAKELFMYYHSTPVILQYLKPVNKTLLNCTMDIFLQMSMESAHLSSFLASCSTEAWFRACSLVIRMPNLEPKVIEKVSIILQKLSKIKSNKKYFEVFAITNVVTELLREQKNENAFLALNLKSVLHNLSVIKSAGVLSRNTSLSSLS